MANRYLSDPKELSLLYSCEGHASATRQACETIPCMGPPLQLVAMDILVPVPKFVTGRQYVLVITERFSKLARTTPMRTRTVPKVADVLLNTWVYPYGTPKYFLSDNGTQSIAKFFEAVCKMLAFTHLLTTAYYTKKTEKRSSSTACWYVDYGITSLTTELSGRNSCNS